MHDRRADFFDALAEPLRKRIRSGDLAPGELLPSEAAIARASGTKRYSVRKALARMRDEDLIEAIPGSGWAVRDNSAPSGSPPIRPRYRQIAGELRTSIEAQDFPPGSYLPSEADLVARFAVSRTTVRKALAILEQAGLIATQPGKGRYVCDR